MLSCLKSLPPPSLNTYFSSPASQGNSIENTSSYSAQNSPTINLTEEFARAVQTNSYREIQRIFEEDTSLDHCITNINHVDFSEEPHLLEQVLQPSRETVQETVSLIKSTPITHLVSSYFEQTEHTARLNFLLYQRARLARHLYTSIHNLLDNFPSELNSNSYSLSQSQCESAYEIFLQFDRLKNPFLSPEEFNDTRQGFSDLRQQVDHHLRKSNSWARRHKSCFSKGSALCLIAAVVGVVVSAVAIATHGMVALVGGPVCLAALSPNVTGKEKVHLSHLDSATKNAYLLYNELDTIDLLVKHLHNVVEDDKSLIRMGLERDMDSDFIQEILKQLQRDRMNFVERLDSLQEHLLSCFSAINKTREWLVEEIHLHQNTG